MLVGGSIASVCPSVGVSQSVALLDDVKTAQATQYHTALDTGHAYHPAMISWGRRGRFCPGDVQDESHSPPRGRRQLELRRRQTDPTSVRSVTFGGSCCESYSLVARECGVQSERTFYNPDGKELCSGDFDESTVTYVVVLRPNQMGSETPSIAHLGMLAMPLVSRAKTALVATMKRPSRSSRRLGATQSFQLFFGRVSLALSLGALAHQQSGHVSVRTGAEQS